ncbi:MAG: hypothetical protein EOO89_01330 [Pedobacter sp.]|nr:MAG: hypothetical protein EOO89_01330 [Pedobacter sp.]
MDEKRKTITGQIKNISDTLGADSDHSEDEVTSLTGLNKDDVIPYSELEDKTPELEKKRIHDKG